MEELVREDINATSLPLPYSLLNSHRLLSLNRRSDKCTFIGSTVANTEVHIKELVASHTSDSPIDSLYLKDFFTKGKLSPKPQPDLVKQVLELDYVGFHIFLRLPSLL